MMFQFPIDKDELDKVIQSLVDRMKERFGYTDQSARDVLERVGQLLITNQYCLTDGDGKVHWPYPINGRCNNNAS